MPCGKCEKRRKALAEAAKKRQSATPKSGINRNQAVGVKDKRTGGFFTK